MIIVFISFFSLTQVLNYRKYNPGSWRYGYQREELWGDYEMFKLYYDAAYLEMIILCVGNCLLHCVPILHV